MTTPDHALRFTEQELAMLGKTADGLSAYMGKSVLAEIGMDDDAEWVIFAIPLGVDETPDEKATHVQMGGPGARFVGNRGGTHMSSVCCVHTASNVERYENDLGFSMTRAPRASAAAD